jgi:CII-binding regulator of phage lambda lysogenization HflD
MNEQNEVQQLQTQVISLKARLFDASEQLQQLNEVIGRVAQKVSFKGQSIEELLQAIPEVKTEEATEGA